MAQINTQQTIDSITHYLDPTHSTYVSFEDALKNKDGDGFCQNGITMCYGHPEGINAITRAYSSLEENIDVKLFAESIAHAINRFATGFSTGQDVLCYPHFLLHGIAKSTLFEIIEQIEANSRIVHEMILVRESLIKRFGDIKKLDDNFCFILSNGQTDDFDGLSFQLFHIDQTLSSLSLLAKAGFFIDVTNNEAIIVNVQGRKNSKEGSKDSIKQNSRLGREYARFASHHEGQEPRVFVLNQLCIFLADIGVKTVRVIRPEEHLMHISEHSGFRTNYDQILEDAGFDIENKIYRVKSL